MNMKTPRARKMRGQWWAIGTLPVRERKANKPITRSIRPTQLWLYSDQAMSEAVFGAATSERAMPTSAMWSAAAVFSDRCRVAGEISLSSGVLSRCLVGLARWESGLRLKRSAFISTAGGYDDIDAATIYK